MNNLEIEALYYDIEQKAADISDSANKGCDKAKQVINLHKMCVNHADLPTITLLSCAFTDWIETV